jgi:hypothetical protein
LLLSKAVGRNGRHSSNWTRAPTYDSESRLQQTIGLIMSCFFTSPQPRIGMARDVQHSSELNETIAWQRFHHALRPCKSPLSFFSSFHQWHHTLGVGLACSLTCRHHRFSGDTPPCAWLAFNRNYSPSDSLCNATPTQQLIPFLDLDSSWHSGIAKN